MLESARLVVPARGRGEDRALLERFGDALRPGDVPQLVSFPEQYILAVA